MSTWQLLELSYPADKICPGRMWEDIITLPHRDLSRYDVFRGHFLSYLERYLGRKLRTFTILRDPLERTISHYYHVRRAPEHPFHAAANALTLEQFCLHRRTRHMVDNYQSRYLACRGTLNPRALAARMTAADLAVYQLQLTLDPDVNEFTSLDELYRAAVRRLDSFVAVGITERLQESFSVIAHALNIPNPPVLPIRNAGWNRPDLPCDARTRRTIQRLTQVDRAIYGSVRGALEAAECVATMGYTMAGNRNR